jgi:hypothetical protein
MNRIFFYSKLYKPKTLYNCVKITKSHENYCESCHNIDIEYLNHCEIVFNTI